MNNFKNYGQLADAVFKNMGLKVETVYIKDGNYSPYAIYLNRIANGNKPKFRILQMGKDKVKNCMKITYNPDQWERGYLERFINTKLKELAHLSIGTCHRFIRQSEVKEVLTGVWSESVKKGASFHSVCNKYASIL